MELLGVHARRKRRFNGQSTTSSINTNGSASARRTTEEWKFSLAASGGYSEDSFELTDRTSTTFQRNYGARSLLVNSLGPQWSIGGRVSVNHSTFLNHKVAIRAAPGLEHDVFPYSEVTRRSLTLQYSIGANYYNYIEESVFEKVLLRRRQLETSYNYFLSVGLRYTFGSPFNNVVNPRCDAGSVEIFFF